jgi:hypothetical protein
MVLQRKLVVVILIIAIMGVVSAPALGAPHPIGPGYPPWGSVSQGGSEVPIEYSGNICVGGVAHTRDGETVCFGARLVGGVYQIPLLTPGSIHVRLSAPARFVSASTTVAGSARVNGVIKQVDPSDGMIMFDRPLVPGSVEVVTVEFEGTEFGLPFIPVNGFTMTHATCSRRTARVAVLAQAAGTLSVDVRSSRRGALLAHGSRRLNVPGSRILKLALPYRRKTKNCSISVTLKNASGRQRATTSV